MSSLSNHPDTSELLAKMAEGNSGVGSTAEPIQTDARQSSQPAVSGNVLKSKRATSSMEESAEEKVQQRIRAASLCCDVRRTGIVSTQFTSKDTVRVLNDQTGQSIVVASNQSTRDALASLVQRESEVEKKEAAAIKLAKEEAELRAMMLEQHTKKFFEEQELKKLEAASSSPPRPRPQSAQPKKRNAYRQQSFAEPMAISTQEAQALLITYLNYTQPEFSGISYQFLAEQQGMAPVLAKMQPPPPPQKKRSSSHKPKTTKATKKDNATATAIVFDSSPPILVNQLEMKPAPNPPPPVVAPQINRAYFGISRFLDQAESAEPIVEPAPPAPPAKPKKTARKPANKTIKSSTSPETADKKTTAKKQTIKAPVVSEASETKMEEVVTAAAPVPCEPSPPDTNATQRSIIFNDPMVAIAAAIHEPPQEPPRLPKPEPEDPERSRLFLWAPGTRSNRGKSDSPSLHKTDAELIEFLRKPLEKAREEEREAARRKMMDPSPKRKPRSAGNAGNASKSSNSSTSNSNQPPTTEPKTVELQTSEPVEATLQDTLLMSQSPPCDFLDDHLLDSAFEDYDFADFQQQQATTDFSSGNTESYRSLRLDMPLGQAMAEVPLESIAGHLQTQKELFFMKKEGKLSATGQDMYQTGEQQQQQQQHQQQQHQQQQQNLQPSSGMEPTSTSKKKAPAKRKQPPKPPPIDGAETAQPKRKRAPPKKKGAQAAEEQQVQNVVQVDAQIQMYQQQQPAHQPIQQPTQQRLPSVDNLLPPINGHYQQSNYGRGGSQETNGQSSSSTSYQSYQYSMNTQAERPKKQQSLASMLQPLNNTGGSSSSQGQQQAVTDNYQNGMMYSMGANGNGEFYGYDDHNSQMSADYTGDGQAHFAPLSVESHISYQSQESNSHMSSMPQTPISNHGSVYNNPVVNDNQMSYTQHNYGQPNDLYANQEYFAPVDSHNHQQYLNGNMQNGVNYAIDQQHDQNGQQLHQQQPQHQQMEQQQMQQQPQPIGELQRLTPMDITEFFSDPTPTGDFNSYSNIVHPADNGNLYSNDQLLVNNDNMRFMPDGRQEILNFVGEDEECEMSTCPADCNKCQSKAATPKPPPIEIVQETKAVVVQKSVPNVTNGTTILKPDAEQISYVQYLSPGDRNLTEPAKPGSKRKQKSKKKADPKAPENDIFQTAPLTSFPENMSIGELLKKRNQFHPNVFKSAASRSMQQSALRAGFERMNDAPTSYSISSSPISTARKSTGPLSLSDVQMMIESRQQMEVDVRSHSSSTPSTIDREFESVSPMDREPPVQPVASRPSSQQAVQPVSQQRIAPPPHRKLLKAIRHRQSPSNRPTSGDPVLDTIDTVISNVMGVNDTLEQYLPVEELNIPANIKLQHKKTIEMAKQHQAKLKLQAEKQPKSNKKPEVKKPQAKKPDVEIINGERPEIEILEPETMEVQQPNNNNPNYTMEQLREMYQNQIETEPTSASFYFRGKYSIIENINAKRRALLAERRRKGGFGEAEIVFPVESVRVQTEEERLAAEQKKLEQKRQREADYEKFIAERQRVKEYLEQKMEREKQQELLQLQQVRQDEQHQNRAPEQHEQQLQNQEQHQQQQQQQYQQPHSQMPNLQHQLPHRRLEQQRRHDWRQEEDDRQHLHQQQAERDIHYPDQSQSYQQLQQRRQQFQPYQQAQQLPPVQQRPQQRRVQNSNNGQAVIQTFSLPPRPAYPSKLAQLLQKPPGAPYTTPKTVPQSPMMHLFDQPACQPSTSLQAAQRAAQEEAEFQAMEAAQPPSPVFFQRPNADPPRVMPQERPQERPQPPQQRPQERPQQRPPPPPRARPSSSSTGASKSNSNNSRSFRVRECIRSVLAYGPLPPEEALGRPEGMDPEEFNQEYMEHWNRTTQDMIDNPCVPEITVDDVLEQPELEPALHGRFRKRLAAVRAGKTTVTKPPPKKKRIKLEEETCTATATTTEESTATVTESEPSTSTATVTKTKSRSKSTTTIKAIVVPSLDLLPDGSLPSTSTEVLSQPLSVLTNDNTNSMGPSPLVSGVQTPVEPNLNNQQLNYQEDVSHQFPSAPYSYTMSYTDGHSTYNRTAGNPMPYNILEGEDDEMEEEEEQRRRDEESRMLLVDTNQVGRRRAPSTHFTFDELIDNGSRGALINDNNDPFLGSMHHSQVDNDPFLSSTHRERGLFDLEDDDDFDIDKDVIDLDGSEDTGPSTPSVGILDDSSFDTMHSSFHGIFGPPPCSPPLPVDNPSLQDLPVVASTDVDIMFLQTEQPHHLDVHQAAVEFALDEPAGFKAKRDPMRTRISRTNYKTIVKKQAVQLSSADLYNLQYKTTRKRGNEFLNPTDARGSGFHLMDQLEEQHRFGQGDSANMTVREIVNKHVYQIEPVVDPSPVQPLAVAEVLEKMEEERAYLLLKAEADRVVNGNVEEQEPRRPAPRQRRGFYQWPESAGYGELTIPRKKSNKRNANNRQESSNKKTKFP